MDKWDSLIEKRIREAMDEGEFDDLPGKGQPLRLDENPFEDPEMRMAHRLLRNNGFTLPWIEERREIETAIEEARTALARAWAVRRDASASGRTEALWQRAVDAFRSQVTDLNRRIMSYNLKAPSPGLQRSPIDAGAEIDRIRRE